MFEALLLVIGKRSPVFRRIGGSFYSARADVERYFKTLDME